MPNKKPEEKTDEKDPIKHVVFLMMENQSFDRKLGDVKKVKPELEGIDATTPNSNMDEQGNRFYQTETRAVQATLDPAHEIPDVRQQVSEQNSGFIKNFVAHYPTSSLEDRKTVMSYYPYGFLPALHALATEFTVCDHWFASVPGPTWTNRFFSLSGTSMGRVSMLSGITDFKHIPELFYQTQTNIFDRLDEKGISWKSYCGDFPISLVLTHNREPQRLFNYRRMSHFFADAKGPADKFPQVSIIEPKYMGKDQNDDHPPHNTMKAEKLIADVYNALRANNELWMSVLFVLVYDEHGGFYDHVTPPKAVPPDEHHEEGYYFDQLGVRVPAILISPWAKKSLEKTVFDHTSFLKYLSEKWALGELGERTKQANSLSVALDVTGEPRTDCLPRIDIPQTYLTPPVPYLEKHHVNANQDTINAFADFLNEKDKAHCEPKVPSLCTTASIKDKIGELLEENGLVKAGEWLREEADEYRQTRMDHTLKIAGNKLAMFQECEKKAEAGKASKEECEEKRISCCPFAFKTGLG